MLALGICKGDPCGGSPCLNGGVCACDAGYEGDLCATESRAKFLGTYLVSSDCSPSDGKTTVISEGVEVDEILISNIFGTSTNFGSIDKVTATVSGNALSFSGSQIVVISPVWTFTGNGSFVDANTMSLNYTLVDEFQNQTVCNETLSK